MFEGLSPKQITDLKTSFQSLTSIEEKFEFWIKKLEKPYCFNSFVDHQTILDFLIKGQTEEEKHLINSLCLDEIKQYGFFFNLQLLNINDKIEEFEKQLSDAKNRRVIVEHEIKLITDIVKQYREPQKDPFLRAEYKFWIWGYEQSYIQHKDLNLSDNVYEARNLINLNNGYVIGEYLKHLDKISDDLANNRDIATQRPTSVKQQLLILEILGILDLLEERFADESDKGVKLKKNFIKLLSIVLNRGEQSIKEALTNLPKKASLYDIKTINNYQFIENLFFEVGLNRSAEEVKNEKDKLSSAK